jgi:hypothetical protein
MKAVYISAIVIDDYMYQHENITISHKPSIKFISSVPQELRRLTMVRERLDDSHKPGKPQRPTQH